MVKHTQTIRRQQLLLKFLSQQCPKASPGAAKQQVEKKLATADELFECVLDFVGLALFESLNKTVS